MNKHSRIQLAAIVGMAVVTCLAVQPVIAAGPLYLCQSGQPYLWPNGGQNVPFNPDQGGLGPLSNADATAAVAAAFGVWDAVASATITHVNAGQLPVDVNFSNFYSYLYPAAPDGYSAIVFDENGDIFNYLYGYGSGILGFASPEWGYIPTCEITEGVAFLNGAEFGDAQAAMDVMVHEFGHYNNIAHTVTNGQVYLGAVGGDHSGPSPNDTFPIPSPYTDVIETMYPYYYGTSVGTATLHPDDISSISAIYPAANFAATTATVTGTIYAPDGVTRLSGVNVIARNIADPFGDAVSAISGDYTDSTSQLDPLTGTYTLRGLTPGADYAIYVDELLAGGFSTTPLSPLPGPEEFYNGADESNDGSTDDPAVYTGVSAAAGATTSGVDIIFNRPGPGVIPLGDDDYAELALPWTYVLCGQTFNSVFVNSNGSLTFGAGDTDFSESVSEFLGELPRIAGHWDDLNPSIAGQVSFSYDDKAFTVVFDSVPEYYSTGANTFAITIEKDSNHIEIQYGDISSSDGLAGVSCGGAITSGYETAMDLSMDAPSRNDFHDSAALFELFDSTNPADLSNTLVRFTGGRTYDDTWCESNDTLDTARKRKLPFDTAYIDRYTEIEPTGADVDFFRFRAHAGYNVVAEVVSGQLDTVLGLFDYSTGMMLAMDDDGGVGLLSKLQYSIPETGEYALAVSTFPDYDFSGDGGSGGRYVLDVFETDQLILALGDDDYVEVGLGFGFPFQGSTWTSMFINSNGSITFGGGDTDYTESVYDLLNDRPRVAGLWDDLRPPSGGQITVQQNATSATVNFVDIPEYYSTGANNFSITLYATGDVMIEYGSVTATDGMVGVSPGLGASDPGETDLSAAGTLSASGTTYELFTGSSDPFDLSGQTLLFVAP